MKVNEKSTLVWLRVIAVTVIGVFVVTLFTTNKIHKLFKNASDTLQYLDISTLNEAIADLNTREK